MQDEVTVHMTAPAEDVWALVSDVTRIGEFSPETFEAEWLGRACDTGPQVGAKFRGHVKRNGVGPVYWTVCKVTTYEPERVFAFAVIFRGMPINTWGLSHHARGQRVRRHRVLPPQPAAAVAAVLGGHGSLAQPHERRRHATHPRAHQGRRRDRAPRVLIGTYFG
jgi:uncharacterized protein YndB with AHSA1/START domain